LRQGNIVDGFFIWNSNDLSKFYRSKLEKELFSAGDLAIVDRDKGFVLAMESSYGAIIYALIKFDGEVSSYLKQISFSVTESTDKMD